MTARLKPLDLASVLQSASDIGLFLSEAVKANDKAYLAHALSIVARSDGLSDVAAQMGISAHVLKHALMSTGDVEVQTVMKMFDVLDVGSETAAVRPAGAVQAG